MTVCAASISFLPSLLLVVFSFGSAARGPDRSAIQCPGAYNCSCTRGAASEYELLCPGSGETSVLSAIIIPDRYIHIECTYSTHPSDYALLNGLRVGPVISVNFRLCPLPNVALSQLIRSIGVNSTRSLLFQSYRNLSNTLEKKHLTGLGNTTRLMLSSNGLTELPPDLLEDLGNLTWLDMRGNNVHLHPDIFQNVPKLESLELGNNGIGYLEPGVFRNLTRLRLLNLWKNQLRNVTRSVLADLKSLLQLDLRSNGMDHLPADAFADLDKLVNLSLSGNNFTALPSGLLSGSPRLEILWLYDNQRALSLPPSFLANLTSLKQVYLMKNNMTSVPEDLLWHSSAVTNLSFTGNLFRTVPDDLFRDLDNLQTLDLSYNTIDTLPDLVFRNLGKLMYLRLGYNRLSNISRDTFHGLQSLELLDLEHNQLQAIHGDAFVTLRSLKHARLSHNQLTFLPPQPDELSLGLSYLEKQSPFHHCVDLEHLHLANNSVTEVFHDWRIIFTKLRTLDLSHNAIQSLGVNEIQFISNELSVDLRHNNISKVDLYHVEAVALSQPDSPYSERRFKRNVRILLEDNPLNCDCSAYDLIRYFETKLTPEVYILVTLVPGNLTCATPERLRGTAVTNMASRELTCELPQLKQCPEQCACSLRRADFGLIVNCTARGLSQVPGRLPTPHYANHTELILDHNSISSLPNWTVPEYGNVTHLFLSHNNLSSMEAGSLPPRLVTLTLDSNHIHRLASPVARSLANSSSLRLLMLHNNPWLCDCSARDLLNLVQLKFQQIQWRENVTCGGDHRPLAKLSVSDLCPVSLAIIVSCVAIAACGVVVGSLAALYYRYQREVKVWLYSHHLCLWFVTEQELDKDKLYDAFVSYSHKDEDFVVNTLVPGLEPQFKLCLHYRDWIAGEWIPNQIARSVEDSRRTLVVLSPNFLESVWGRMEFRAAHKQALSEGRARVIVVLYGDVGATAELDPELRAYISMNTYVKWGDPWFWRKLRYSLPHPPDLVKGGLLKRRGSRKEKHFLDDKLELIHTLDSPATPPGATTPPAEAMETIATTPNGKSIGNGHAKTLA